FTLEAVSGPNATLRAAPGGAGEALTVSRGEWHTLVAFHLEDEARPVYLDGKLWVELGERPEVVTGIALGRASAGDPLGSGEVYLDDVLLARLVPKPRKPAVTYVVDPRHPDADDKNPGTAQKPLRTIGRGAEL